MRKLALYSRVGASLAKEIDILHSLGPLERKLTVRQPLETNHWVLCKACYLHLSLKNNVAEEQTWTSGCVLPVLT